MEQSQAPGDPGQTAESSSASRTVDVSILGGRKFKGRWRPPRTMTLVSLLGGRELDFREAEIPPEGITINAFGLIGGTHVIVPDGVNVEVSGFSGLGGGPFYGTGYYGGGGLGLVLVIVLILVLLGKL